MGEEEQRPKAIFRPPTEDKGTSYLVAGIVGFYVVNMLGNAFLDAGWRTAWAWTGLIGKLLCLALVIAGILLMRRKSKPTDDSSGRRQG
jgi:hypothetical protein